MYKIELDVVVNENETTIDVAKSMINDLALTFNVVRFDVIEFVGKIDDLKTLIKNYVDNDDESFNEFVDWIVKA